MARGAAHYQRYSRASNASNKALQFNFSTERISRGNYGINVGEWRTDVPAAAASLPRHIRHYNRSQGGSYSLAGCTKNGKLLYGNESGKKNNGTVYIRHENCNFLVISPSLWYRVARRSPTRYKQKTKTKGKQAHPLTQIRWSLYERANDRWKSWERHRDRERVHRILVRPPHFQQG